MYELSCNSSRHGSHWAKHTSPPSKRPRQPRGPQGAWRWAHPLADRGRPGHGQEVVMRRALLSLGLGVIALELVSIIGTAQVAPPEPPPTPPPSLKTVPVPEPENLADFVKDKAAAVALGKALFWDTQVASDGRVACASCHFQAGVDVRASNQLNP